MALHDSPSRSEALLRLPDATKPLTGELYGRPRCIRRCRRSIAANRRRISNDELIDVDVDILAPAALEGVIGPANADRICASIILEVANGPVRSEVDDRLSERGIVVVPDILANAGGVVVSYFEWVQNRSGYAWTLAEVRERLQATLATAFQKVWDAAKSEERSLFIELHNLRHFATHQGLSRRIAMFCDLTDLARLLRRAHGRRHANCY